MPKRTAQQAGLAEQEEYICDQCLKELADFPAAVRELPDDLRRRIAEFMPLRHMARRERFQRMLDLQMAIDEAIGRNWRLEHYHGTPEQRRLRHIVSSRMWDLM